MTPISCYTLMRHVAALLLLITTMTVWSADNSTTEAELVGIWRVDTNLLHRQTLPTNFLAFAVTLQANGTFVATNVPADFFFDYTPHPASAQAGGTWTFKPHQRDGTDKLFLNFTKPSEGSWSSDVQFKFAGVPYFSRVNRRYIRMGYHVGKPDVLLFYLIKKD
jgi:hypothetical protein